MIVSHLKSDIYDVPLSGFSTSPVISISVCTRRLCADKRGRRNVNIRAKMFLFALIFASFVIPSSSLFSISLNDVDSSFVLLSAQFPGKVVSFSVFCFF